MPKDFLPQYDIAYARAGTAGNKGFMLAEEEGKRLYRESRARPLLPQYTVGQATYGAFPPEQDMAIAVAAMWHAGFGDLDYGDQVGAGKEYYESIGWDSRERNVLKLSPQERSATVNLIAAAASTNFANFDFETWTDATTLDSWTKGPGVTTTREASTIQGGTYSCKLASSVAVLNSSFEDWSGGATGDPDSWTLLTGNLDRNSSVVNDGTYSAIQPVSTTTTAYLQDLTWDDDYQGQVVTFSYYSYSNAGLNREAGIDDGVTGSYGTVVNGTNTWQLTTCTKTLDAAATMLRLMIRGATTGGGQQNLFDGPMTVVVGGRTIYQNIGSWASYFNNKAATLTFQCWTDTGSDMRIGIDDEASTTWSGYHAGDSAWENLSVTATVAATATRLRAVVQRATTASVAYVDTGTFVQAAAARGTPLALFQWGTTWYYIENKTIFSASGTVFTEKYTFLNTPTDYVAFGANLVVACGTANNYLYSADGDAWTPTSSTACRMKYFGASGSTLYGTSSDYQIKSTINPTTEGGWSTATPVGEAAAAITDLVEYNQAIHVGKANEVFYLSASTFVSLSPDFKGRADTANFEKSIAAHGVLLLPNVEGLARYYYTSYGDLSDISPKRYAISNTAFHGRCRAAVGDLQWIYTAHDPASTAATKSKVMATRLEAISGVEVSEDYRWHPFQEVDINPVKSMGIFNDKLWLAGANSAGSSVVKYFALDGTDYPSASAGVKVEFEIDEAGSWTELTAAGSGSYTTTDGIKSFQSNQSGKRIRFRLTAASQTFVTPYYDGGIRGLDKNFLTFELYGTDLNAATSTVTPRISSLVCRGVLASPSLRLVECAIKVEDGVALKGGRQDTVLGDSIKTFLNNAVADTNPGTFYDIRGNSFAAKMVPPSPVEEPVKEYNPERVQTIVRLALQEVKDS